MKYRPGSISILAFEAAVIPVQKYRHCLPARPTNYVGSPEVVLRDITYGIIQVS